MQNSRCTTLCASAVLIISHLQSRARRPPAGGPDRPFWILFTGRIFLMTMRAVPNDHGGDDQRLSWSQSVTPLTQDENRLSQPGGHENSTRLGIVARREEETNVESQTLPRSRLQNPVSGPALYESHVIRPERRDFPERSTRFAAPLARFSKQGLRRPSCPIACLLVRGSSDGQSTQKRSLCDYESDMGASGENNEERLQANIDWWNRLTRVLHDTEKEDFRQRRARLTPQVMVGAIAAIDKANTWEEIEGWLSANGDEYLYRGQTNSAWTLSTSIDRFRTLSREDMPVATLRAFELEQFLLDAFKTRAHHYYRDTPPDSDLTDWLALMQHHGTPTRLLDLTASPYVGLYFSLETALESGSTSGHALWAISKSWLRKVLSASQGRTEPMMQSEQFALVNLLLKQIHGHRIATVIPSRRINERMAAQQAVLLANVSELEPIDQTFMEMLRTNAPTVPPIRQLVIDKKARIAGLLNLRRMNIGGVSLFPGLDGLSRHLRLEFEVMLQLAEVQDIPQS
jgi:hypothetical protein